MTNFQDVDPTKHKDFRFLDTPIQANSDMVFRVPRQRAPRTSVMLRVDHVISRNAFLIDGEEPVISRLEATAGK